MLAGRGQEAFTQKEHTEQLGLEVRAETGRS